MRLQEFLLPFTGYLKVRQGTLTVKSRTGSFMSLLNVTVETTLGIGEKLN